MRVFGLQNEECEINNQNINDLLTYKDTYRLIDKLGLFIKNNELLLESSKWKFYVDEKHLEELKDIFVYTSTRSLLIEPCMYEDYLNKKIFTDYEEKELFFSLKIENIFNKNNNDEFILDIKKILSHSDKIMIYIDNILNKYKFLKLTDEFMNSYVYNRLLFETYL